MAFPAPKTWNPIPGDSLTVQGELKIVRVEGLLKDPSVRDASTGDELVPDQSSLEWIDFNWIEDGCKSTDEVDDMPPHSTTICPECIDGSWNEDWYLRVTYQYVMTSAPQPS
jgi:hypothetical protein